MIRTSSFIVLSFLLIMVNHSIGQSIKLDAGNIEAVQVAASFEKLDGKNVIKLVKDSSVKEVDEPTFARIRGIDFSEGVIEVRLLSKLQKDAPDFARGFIGIAFRINDSNTRYESVYLRPVNARVNDQVRRNHSVQYYAYPNYKYDRLRGESPEKYESYADMEMNKWISLRLEVSKANVRVFVNDVVQPVLVVTDLKLGPQASGGIGLWVDVGTEGYFTDLRVRKN